MAIQTINVGAIANDGSGDDLREAFIKVNLNFQDLDLRASAATASNVGIGTSLFKEKVDSDFKFRSLAADPNAAGTMTFRVSDDGNTLFLSSTQATLVFTDNTNTITSNVASPIIFKGATNTGAVVTVDNNTKTVTVDSQLVRESSPAVSAPLNMQNNNIVNCGTINDINISSLASVGGTDFGSTGTATVNSILDYLVAVQDVDMGTIASPVNVNIDEGLIVS
jgi:hypothetical protein|tara:strand:+ start:2049 stop:2717 length:669 start_codon:yes stop_codon:yes gene_type:complete